jgi:hypothetical protein
MISDFFLNFIDRCGEEEPKLTNFIPENAGKMLKFDSRRELMLSLCVMENLARSKLGIESMKPCNYNKLMRRWRYDDGYM